MRRALVNVAKTVLASQETLISCAKILRVVTYLAFRGLPSSFYPIATLNDIGLETDGSWATVEFQEETACVAENGAQLISAPEGSG